MNEISFGRCIGANPKQGIHAALSPTGGFAGLLLNKEQGGTMVAAPTLVAVQE
jgi:hypothetical protein